MVSLLTDGAASAAELDVRMVEVENTEMELPEYYTELKCSNLRLSWQTVPENSSRLVSECP